MSITNPVSCGFVKVAIYELLIRDHSRLKNNTETSLVYHEHLDFLKATFPFVDLTYEQYKKQCSKVKESIFSLGKNSGDQKQNLITVFNLQHWQDCKQKNKHSLKVCKGCLHNEVLRIALQAIPVKDKCAKRKATEEGLYLPRKKYLEEVTIEKVKEINQEFKDKYSTNFEKIFKSVVSKKESEKKNIVIRKVKENIESQWKETDVLRYSTI